MHELSIGRELSLGRQVSRLQQNATKKQIVAEASERVAETDVAFVTHLAFVSEKPCSLCRVVKPRSGFHSHRSHQDGLTSRCQKCTQKARQAKVDALSKNTPDANTLKCCCKCRLEKAATEFYRYRYSSDGLNPSCIQCLYDVKCRREGRETVVAPRRKPEVFLDPDRKRCIRCQQIKSRTRDFHPLTSSSDGYRADCRECKRATWNETYRRDRDKVLAQRAIWRSINRERRNTDRRAEYAQNPEKHREQLRKYRREHPDWSAAQQRKWRLEHIDHVRDRSRKYYCLHAKELCENRRAWRKANLAHVRQQEREQAKKHREVRLHRCRVWYWSNPQRARMLARLARERSERRQSEGRHSDDGRTRPGGKYRQTVSLNDTFGDGSISRMDRVADTRVVSPEAAALEAPSLQAVRAFVRQQVTDQEREILEAFADCFSVEGTAELLGITPGEVEATLTAIRSRAAALREE